jgi:hypothetical protein
MRSPFQILTFSLLSTAAGLAGCGGDSGGEVTPGPLPTTDARPAPDAATDAAPPAQGDAQAPSQDAQVPQGDAQVPQADAEAPQGDAAVPSEDAEPPTGDAQVPDAEPPVDCVDPAGCWRCAPVEQTHFLNRCTTSDCSPFDNAARLPLFASPLPPLP